MSSVNRVIIVGNLGKDPETRYLPSGQAVCSFSVATSERYKDKSGEQQERTEWHLIKAWGKLAEICGEYLKKGSKVYIEGSIRTEEYKAQDGTPKRLTTIVASEMRMLDSARGDNPERQKPAAKPAQKPAPANKSGFDDMDDSDIPW